jgi:endonuclease/exonuclease/phosphatase (EEP) superfamily protein YafD
MDNPPTDEDHTCGSRPAGATRSRRRSRHAAPGFVTRLRRLLALVPALALGGCVNVPDTHRLMMFGASAPATTAANAACDAPVARDAAPSGQHAALDAADLRLLVWNVQKAKHAGWSEDFLRLGTPMDILLLQEAHLTEPFSSTMEQSGFHWSMAHAFTYSGSGTGVLTASRTPASRTCLTRTAEPLVRLPKSALITWHPLGDAGSELLMANLHGINFSTGTGRFSEQLDEVADILRAHDGPLILAGDFNDWSERRSAILESLAGELGLLRLALSEDRRSRHFGRPVDHVFYRDLDVLEARSEAVTSSDHNPLLVRFRLPGHHEGQL